MHRLSLRRLAAATLASLALTAWGTAGPANADGSVPNPAETIDTTFTPDELAQSLVGPGVSVSNVTFTGSADSAGRFGFSDPNVVGFGSGLVMSSGRAADVVGPNVSDWTSTDLAAPGDDQLTALSTYQTFDATVLEFDFVPAANQVTFKYVFASDEYPEWVDTEFNDVFAFFINGTNCATERKVGGDPSSPFVPVAVNNINNSNPIHDPMPVAMRPDLFRANYYGDAGPGTVDLELDGLTSVLTCQAPVVPDATNHMKLAIADASDGVYDSAVFLQAGSLVSNDNPVADLSLYPNKGTAPFTTSAIVEAEDPDGAALTYTLDFGDGTVVTGALPNDTDTVEHTYAYGGHYNVSLTVSNGSKSGTATDDVEVDGPAAPPAPPEPPAPPADTTPPSLSPSLSSPSPLLVGAAGVTASANATDDSGVATQACDPVDTATAGAKTITCTATDGAGNTATVTLDYVVGYRATIAKPVAGATFKRGSSVAVSYTLADANGRLADSAAAALVSSSKVSLGALAPVTPKYATKSHSFTASLPTSRSMTSGIYVVTVKVTAGATEVAASSVSIKLA